MMRTTRTWMASTGATSCQPVSASGSECRTVTQAAMKRSLKTMKTATMGMGIGTKGSPCQSDACDTCVVHITMVECILRQSGQVHKCASTARTAACRGCREATNTMGHQVQHRSIGFTGGEGVLKRMHARCAAQTAAASASAKSNAHTQVLDECGPSAKILQPPAQQGMRGCA